MGITTKVLMALAITSIGWWMLAPDVTPTSGKSDFQPMNQTAPTENQKTKDDWTHQLGIMKLQSELDAHKRSRLAEPRDPNSPFKQRENANWKGLEADNGAVIRVDLNSIERDAKGVAANIVVYVVEGETYNPGNLKQFVIDCAGHRFMDASAFGIWNYAPPRSVSGQIERIACGR